MYQLKQVQREIIYAKFDQAVVGVPLVGTQVDAILDLGHPQGMPLHHVFALWKR